MEGEGVDVFDAAFSDGFRTFDDLDDSEISSALTARRGRLALPSECSSGAVLTFSILGARWAGLILTGSLTSGVSSWSNFRPMTTVPSAIGRGFGKIR